MYARSENGIINIYHNIPTSLNGLDGNCLGGYDKKAKSIHEADGFWEIINPVLPSVLYHYTTNLIPDESTKTFIRQYELTEPNLTLIEAKTRKITELKQQVSALFNITDWYYDRQTRTTEFHSLDPLIPIKTIPTTIIDRDENLYASCDLIESQINSLTSIEDVLNYVIQINI